jgi:hypothetical protein
LPSTVLRHSKEVAPATWFRRTLRL